MGFHKQNKDMPHMCELYESIPTKVIIERIIERNYASEFEEAKHHKAEG